MGSLSWRSWTCVFAASGALVFAASGCGQPPLGPSLSNVALANVSLQATAGDSSLCCCRAVGTATNNNSVPVDVTVKFSAFSGSDPIPLGTVIYFIENMQPGNTQPIDASGFLFSCARITQLKSELDVKGLSSPGF
jgi:hypothetical protein